MFAIGSGKNYILEDFSGSHQICRTLGIGGSEFHCPTDHLLDVASGLDLTGVSAVLSYNCRLIRDILQPVDEPSLVVSCDSLYA